MTTRTRRSIAPWAAGLTATALAAAVYAVPSVYPTGTTIYDPDRAWNGYTVFIAPEEVGAIVVDMNGNTVKHWEGYHGGAGGPARILPGGYVLAAGPTRPPHQESNALIQMDFEGNVVWQFDRLEQVPAPDGETIWTARQHHDWQREGLHAGYYSPEHATVAEGGRTLVLVHMNHTLPNVSPNVLEDDRIIEISADGEILWDWNFGEHIDELGFSDRARELLLEERDLGNSTRGFDWMHVNSATWLGPNRMYDAGDERFHPDNIIISSRYANLTAIIARDGSIPWRLGPDYSETEGGREIGQVQGQHNPHLIPKGLPGAGNLLVFDNGANAGWGSNNVEGAVGPGNIIRANSRVLEIDPVTLEVVWSYSMAGREAFKFYSHYISNAQRLENGNTLIIEGADGRLFEVTPDGDIVWEYVSPYFVEREALSNAVYRAYRLPYDWIPQLDTPIERRVVPPDLSEFRIAPQ